MTTIEIALAVVITGLALGLALAVMRAFQLKPLNALIVVFVDMFRALPPLVIVLIVYFGLPNVGISLPSFAVLWLVLSLVLAAFAEEIFWAGILSVPKGQWEAARSTGFGFLGTLGYIVLPQAVRLTVPPITNRTVAITKNTALGTVIGVPEILNQATTAQSFSGNATPLMMGAIAYVILFIPVVAFGRFLETRFAWRRSLMDALIHQFFNLDIMARALPLVLHGPAADAPALPRRDPARPRSAGSSSRSPRSRGSRTVRWGMIVAIDFFRAVPPLVLLIFVYSGLPFAGIRLSPLTAVAVAFFLNTSSYYGEIYRAGIESVGRGQWDAARSTGLSAFADAHPRGAAAGDPQRAARSRLQHRRGGEAHLDRQRGGAAGTALFRRHGALGHLQRLADRACGGDLSRHAMAGGPADQPARTENGDR